MYLNYYDSFYSNFLFGIKSISVSVSSSISVALQIAIARASMGLRDCMLCYVLVSTSCCLCLFVCMFVYLSSMYSCQQCRRNFDGQAVVIILISSTLDLSIISISEQFSIINIVIAPFVRWLIASVGYITSRTCRARFLILV